MPYEVFTRNDIVYIRYFGAVNHVDLISVANFHATNDVAGPSSPDRIILVNEVKAANLDFEEMECYARMRRSARLLNKVKSAIVAQTPFQLGMSRMFQELNSNPLIEVQIFPTTAAAVSWVRPGQEAAPFLP